MGGRPYQVNGSRGPVPSSQGPLSIAFPSYKVNKPSCSDSQLLVKSSSGSKTLGTELVQDINQIALKNLDDRKMRVLAKTAARAAIKQAAANNLIENDQAKVLFNVFNTLVLEKADTRTWRTLPGEIYMTRGFLEEGTYNISGANCGREEHLNEIAIKAGETRFVMFDTMY